MKPEKTSASLADHPMSYYSIKVIITGCLPEDRGSIPRSSASSLKEQINNLFPNDVMVAYLPVKEIV